MEFETVQDQPEEFYLERLSSCIPQGIRLFSCTKLTETGKTSLAAAVEYASYVVKFRGSAEANRIVKERLQEYIRQDAILCQKTNKKKKVVEVDIRPLILAFSAAASRAEETVFSMTLKTGTRGNLNPEMLIKSFCEFCGVEYLRHHWDYRRTEMYFIPDGSRNMESLTAFPG